MTTQSLYQPKTLGDFNLALCALSLRPVNKERLDEILLTQSKELIVKALNRAHMDQRALAYLNNLFGVSETPTQEVLPQQMAFDDQRCPTPSPRSQPPQPKYQDTSWDEDQQGEVMNSEESSANAQEERGYLKKHVYGGKAALCFEADTTRSGIHTVSLDAADATAPRQYNWGSKIRLQMTRDELLVVAGVLFGMIPSCEYKNHGEDNSKGFSIEDQGDKLFVKVFAKDQKVKAVPVTPEDAFYVAQIFLNQMKKNAPWLEAGEIMSTLQRVVATRKAPRRAA